VLQCVAVCCSVLQCVAVCCSVLQCVAVCCSILQYVALYCYALQGVAVCCSMLQCVAVCCSVLQCVAVCCSGYIACGRTRMSHVIHTLVIAYTTALHAVRYSGDNHWCIYIVKFYVSFAKEPYRELHTPPNMYCTQ